MTVRELIELLEQLNPDSDVKIPSQTGGMMYPSWVEQSLSESEDVVEIT